MVSANDRRDPVTPKGRATKELLLDAGEAVAAHSALAALSIASVTSQAGVAKGTFYIYFDDRTSFVEALRLRFYAHVEAAVLEATDGLPHGPEFLLAVANGYLDACLHHAAMKGLVTEARASMGASASFAGLLKQFESLVTPSLIATNRGPAPMGARLLIAMLSEVALSESDTGAPDPDARLALRHWLAQR